MSSALKVKCDRPFWKTLGLHTFGNDESCDLMGMFTSACARTYDFSHLSRTIIRSSIIVVRCAVKKWLLNVSPFLHSSTLILLYSDSLKIAARFVCLFVGIKPEKLYSASFVWREVKPLGMIAHGFDWCRFYYFAKSGLVVMLETLYTGISFLDSLIGFFPSIFLF